MSQTIFLPDETATLQLGAKLAAMLRPGDVIALHGGLGMGKTTLTRGLIRALCGAGTDVPSPTYTLVQTYDAPDFTLYHFDLYRLEDPSEVFELGWDETADGASLVEWPDRAGAHLPKWRLDITLEADGDGRIATLMPHGDDWSRRLPLLELP